MTFFRVNIISFDFSINRNCSKCMFRVIRIVCSEIRKVML